MAWIVLQDIVLKSLDLERGKILSITDELDYDFGEKCSEQKIHKQASRLILRERTREFNQRS